MKNEDTYESIGLAIGYLNDRENIIKNNAKTNKKICTCRFFCSSACINYSYMIQYIRIILNIRRKYMLKENIKNYDLDELKAKLEELRRKEVQGRANFPLDI